VQSEETKTDNSTPAGFGDDDLGRLQGILFGDQAKKTDERIATLEQALLGAIDDLRSSMEAQFDAVDRRIDGEVETRSKAVVNVTDQVKEEKRARTSGEKTLRSDVDKMHEATTRSIDDLEERATQSLEDARSQIASDIDSGLQALGDRSVPRDDLAQALVRAAEELAEKRES